MKNHIGLITMMSAAVIIANTAFGTATWDGGGGDNKWGTANNWNPDAIPPSKTGTLTINGAYTVVYDFPYYTAANLGTLLANIKVQGDASLTLSADFNNSGWALWVYDGTVTQTGGDFAASLVQVLTWFPGGPWAYTFEGGSLTLAGYTKFEKGTFNFAAVAGGLDCKTPTVTLGVAAGGKPGTLTVLGAPTVNTFTRSAAGAIACNIYAGAQYEVDITASGDKFLDVDGTVTIASGTTLTVTDSSGGTAAGEFDVLTVSGGGAISGTFGTVTLPTDFVVKDNGTVDGSYTIEKPVLPKGTIFAIR